MNRRESIKASAFFTGNLLMPSLVSLFFQRCSLIRDKGEDWKPVICSPEQAAFLPDLVELIIPTTDSPGAKQALVHVFIDLYIKDCYPQPQQGIFLKGLDDLRTNVAFTSGDEKTQIEVLDQLEQESHQKNLPLESSFIKMAKRLTILGYFTSEIGATRAAEYIAVPGPFQGCIDLQPGQKVSAL